MCRDRQEMPVTLDEVAEGAPLFSAPREDQKSYEQSLQLREDASRVSGNAVYWDCSTPFPAGPGEPVWGYDRTSED